jgi:hypothetical protein
MVGLVIGSVRSNAQSRPLADEIRQAATSSDALLRPLPLAAHWNTGTKQDGFGPEYQRGLLDAGYHILPWLALPVPGDKNPDISYYEPLLRQAADKGLPIALISTQWERYLSIDPRYTQLPAAANPNVVKQDGSIDQKASPVGGASPWREVGRAWGTQPLLAEIERLYPDPPRVILLSNNEHAKLRWKDAYQDLRFAEQFGTSLSAEQIREKFADGWKVRYASLFAGMRESFSQPAWQTNSIVVGYNALIPPSVGRWPGWIDHSITTTHNLSAWTSIWQGASLPYYTHHWDASTDFRVWSPQVEAMNWRSAIDTMGERSNYWVELSTWDGNRGKNDDKRLLYEKLGQTYGPDRYEGMVQYGLWLIQPRVLREFRGYAERRADYEPYFQAVLRSVERVHRHPDLRTFWQQGTLVANTARPHPYQTDLPESFAKIQRWRALSTSSDSPAPWKLDTPIEVFALAYVLGEKPTRRWLVYAHAPLGLKKQVTINIPDFSGLQVDVPRAGGFWLIDESPPSVQAIETRVISAPPDR